MGENIINKKRDTVLIGDTKLYQSVLGFAIGDALGVPYEFMERGTFECKDMTGYGTHNQPEGTWSDDTSMTLATLKSLKDNCGKVHVESIRANFMKWINEGAFTANGDVFDIGHATLKALTTGRPRTGEFENGNGSLMRILPLAFVDCSDDEIRAVSAITHGHWISKEACVIYVHVARRLIAGEGIEEIIPTLKYDKPFDRLCRINGMDVSEIKSSGYVVDTLEAALWAVSQIGNREVLITGHSEMFSESVKRAINLGEDTDTVGAVTGGLAGIIYGLGLNGKKWSERIRNKDLIFDCLWNY